MKCNCKSAPEYHREDCQFFDIYGNIKKNNYFFYTINDLKQLNKELFFTTKGYINKKINIFKIMEGKNAGKENGLIYIYDDFSNEELELSIEDNEVKKLNKIFNNNYIKKKVSIRGKFVISQDIYDQKASNFKLIDIQFEDCL